MAPLLRALDEARSFLALLLLLPPCGFALVAAADLAAVARQKRLAAFRAGARFHHRSPSCSGPIAMMAYAVQYAAQSKSRITS